MRILFESHGLNEFGESETYKAFRVIENATRYAEVTVVVPQRWVEHVPSLARLAVDVIGVPYDSRRYPYNTRLEYMYREFSSQAVAATREMLPTVDVVHRLNPNAVRFTSELAFQGRPFVIGPVGWSRLPAPWSKTPLGAARNALKSLDTERVRRPSCKLARMYETAHSIALVNMAALEVFPARLQEKCRLTYEWIDTKAHPALEPPDNDVPVILYVGRMIPYKGVECLIDALSTCTDISWRCLLLGDGPLEKELKHRVLSRGLQKRVEFLGRVPRQEVSAYYGLADICCFPGVNESSGNVNVEAMAAGRPVVVADWAGPREIITPECGIRVPVGTYSGFVERLASAFRHLLSDEELRRKMGAAGRFRAVSIYDVDVAMRRFRQLHENAADSGRGVSS